MSILSPLFLAFWHWITVIQKQELVDAGVLKQEWIALCSFFIFILICFSIYGSGHGDKTNLLPLGSSKVTYSHNIWSLDTHFRLEDPLWVSSCQVWMFIQTSRQILAKMSTWFLKISKFRLKSKLILTWKPVKHLSCLTGFRMHLCRGLTDNSRYSRKIK